MKILLTGSDGHLAQHLAPRLEDQGHHVTPYDLPHGDVRNHARLHQYGRTHDLCIHLAGLKYAPEAEPDPIPTVNANITGTHNVCQAFGTRVIAASTCKAADPETVYGATKLIAERIVLQHAGRIIRLVNVLGSPGSVTTIWASFPTGEPIPVMDCTRLFISVDRATSLFLDAIDWPTGRYGPHDARRSHMSDVAALLYPNRPTVMVARRRGDRQHERLLATCEAHEPWEPGVTRITGPHDPAQAHAVEAMEAA